MVDRPAVGARFVEHWACCCHVAGALIWAAGPGWAFVLDAASFAVSATLLSIIAVRHVPQPERRSLTADLLHGWHEIRSRTWFWTSLLGHGTWNGAAAVLTFLPTR